ncbi:phage tail tape measure protein [Streptomyces sp. NPDC047968]|uniref:phage tail tape measure protein n=1 Tax=unclassified Streptomyces TaxID=2593676 RepID=UPI00343A2E5E
MALLDELLVRIGMDASGVEEGTQEVTSRLDGLAGPAALAGAAAGGVFAVGLSSAMDIAEARSNLEDQLGLTAEESERAGGIAGDVFSSGFGGSLDDVNAALGGIHNSIGDLGDFTDAELEDMSEKALGLAKRFEVDVADATGAVGQLIKTGLVADAEEGFDLVTKAMQEVPAELRDDVIPTVQEYSTQFRRIGLDGQTSMGLLMQAVEAGARDMDQVADAIGQFGERTLAGGDAAEEAFKSIGLNGKEMAKLVGQGGKSAEKALQMTTDALRDTEDEQTRLNAAAALFGDPANVMGEALFALDPATAAAASGMDKAAGAAGDLTDGMKDDPAQQLTAAMNTFQQTLGEALLPILTKASAFFAEHQTLLEVLVPIVLGLAVALGVFAVAVWLVNAAMAANPITWIILGIIALIAVVVLIIAYWDELAAATAEAWAWITAQLGKAWAWVSQKASQLWAWLERVFGDGWDWIAGKLSDGWDWMVRNVFSPIGRFFTETIPGWVGKGLGWIQDKWNGMVRWFGGIPGRLASLGRGMWGFISDGLRSALNGAISLVNSGISFINNRLIANANRLPGVSIPWIPYIPYLADGGITTGPTLAMIGEGSEQEAVLPLSRLEQLIATPAGMPAPSVSRVQPVQVTFSLEGGSRAFRKFFQDAVRVDGQSSLTRYAAAEV